MTYNLKHAILIPLFKQAVLHPDILNHFRPVSKKTYISKLVEKSVILQFLIMPKDMDYIILICLLTSSIIALNQSC